MLKTQPSWTTLDGPVFDQPDIESSGVAETLAKLSQDKPIFVSTHAVRYAFKAGKKVTEGYLVPGQFLPIWSCEKDGEARSWDINVAVRHYMWTAMIYQGSIMVEKLSQPEQTYNVLTPDIWGSHKAAQMNMRQPAGRVSHTLLSRTPWGTPINNRMQKPAYGCLNRLVSPMKAERWANLFLSEQSELANDSVGNPVIKVCSVDHASDMKFWSPVHGEELGVSVTEIPYAMEPAESISGYEDVTDDILHDGAMAHLAAADPDVVGIAMYNGLAPVGTAEKVFTDVHEVTRGVYCEAVVGGKEEWGSNLLAFGYTADDFAPFIEGALDPA